LEEIGIVREIDFIAAEAEAEADEEAKDTIEEETKEVLEATEEEDFELSTL
jgi:hypothetical protein